MSEFVRGQRVRIIPVAGDEQFAWNGDLLRFRHASIANGEVSVVETDDDVLHFVPTKLLRGVTPVTTPAEQAVYDRIERVLDALADSEREAGMGASELVVRTRTANDLPAFAALLEAEFTNE